MKKFEILRYLKRFSILIFLVSLAGAAAIYLYADGKQQYTASVIIRYTNDGISDGYTPDGSDLDVNEIYSSTVISQAMDALGASGRLSTIRSNISVTPVISEEQQTINDALLDKGEEVTYFPDTYKVSLVVDGSQGAGYARNMLDAIIQSYCTYYTENMWSRSFRSTHPPACWTTATTTTSAFAFWKTIPMRCRPICRTSRKVTRTSVLPAPATPMQTCAISIPILKIHHSGTVRLCAQWPAGAGRHSAAGVSGQLH